MTRFSREVCPHCRAVDACPDPGDQPCPYCGHGEDWRGTVRIRIVARAPVWLGGSHWVVPLLPGEKDVWYETMRGDS